MDMKKGKESIITTSITSIMNQNDFLYHLELETSSFKKLKHKQSKHKYKSTNVFIKIKSYINDILSNILFLWVIPILSKAKHSKQPLKPYNLGQISPFLNANIFLNELLPFWHSNRNKPRTQLKYPLFHSIFQANLKSIIIIMTLSLTKSIFALTNVFLFRQTLLCFNPKNEEKPYFTLSTTIILLLLVKLLTIFISRKTEFMTEMQGAKTTIQISSLIYDKLLHVSTYNNFAEGKIVHFVQTDSEKFAEFFVAAPNNLILPFQISFYIVILFRYFGPCFIISLLCLFGILFGLSYVQRMKINFQKNILVYKDERLKTTTELFNFIKYLKLYSWEDYFKEKILSKRNKELEKLQQIQYTQLIINCTYGCSSTIIGVISIIIYNMCYTNTMDISNMLTAIYIFNDMTGPLFTLPNFITNLFETFISMKRLEEFLFVNDHNFEQVLQVNNVYSDITIKIHQSDFGIKHNNTILLRDINLTITKGKLIGIFGEVGSGKTSLLNCILNNYDVLHSDNSKNKIYINGSISYISQSPWILNDTLRNNILFFNEMNEDKYKKIIHLCELEEDIKHLNGGDMAELGEKGLNLSGGQKARIALARALYSNADIYLFDDPLSAVDAYVGRKLFTEVMKGYLRGKTILLVTHSFQYINDFDEVVFMKNGRVELHDTLDNIGSNSNYSAIYNSFIDSMNKMNTSNNNNSSKGSSSTVTTTTSVESFVMNNDNNNNNVNSVNINDTDCTPLTINVSSSNDNDNMDYNNKVIRITKDEFAHQGKVKMHIWMKYFSYIGGIMFLILVFITNVLWKICEISSDYFLSYWTEQENLSNTKNKTYLRYYLYITLLGTFFVFLRAYVTTRSVVKYNKTMHDKLLTKLIKAPINLFHDTIPRGQILNRLSKDLDKSTKLCWSTSTLFRYAFQLCGSIFVCLFFNWYSLLLLPILIYIDYRIYDFYISGGRDLNRLEGTSRSPIISVFSETMNGIQTIRAYNYEDKFKEKYYSKLNNFYKILLYQSGSTNWFGLCLNLISFILLLVILLFAVMLQNKLSPRSMGMLLSYSMKLNDYLYSLLSRITKLEKQITCVERCDSFTEIVQEQPSERSNDVLLKQQHFPIKGEITFKNYSNKYRPNTPLVLNNISINLHPGEKVGIVGRTGCGKSTLCLSLFRLIEPTSGNIYIDNVDITSIGLKYLREIITIIPQDQFLFEGRLRDNIDPLEKYTDAQIKDILNKVGLEKYNKELTMDIAENGSNLSIGEQQLICIARALLRNNKIVIMDEATASVDYETETIIQNVVCEQMKEFTVLTIAHRIKTVLGYDKILVLDKGKVVECGHPKELLKNTNGMFYDLYMQSLGKG